MNDLAHAAQAVRKTTQSSPKTILQFFWGILGLDVAFVVGGIVVTSRESALRYLVVWILGFGAAIFLVVIIIVVYFTAKAPTKLQLDQMTGTEYIAALRYQGGDDQQGEVVQGSTIVEVVSPPKADDQVEGGSPELPSGREPQ